MDLLNQTLNSFSAQISDLSVGLNPDIFETNVVNITILLGGIIYLGSNALSASLSERQQKILGAIQEAEERLQQAVARLAESEKQLEQAQLVIDSIKTDAEKTAMQVKSTILNDGKEETFVTLNKPDKGLLIEKGVWRELENFSSGSVCLVLASDVFDEADYIRDFETFKNQFS